MRRRGGGATEDPARRRQPTRLSLSHAAPAQAHPHCAALHHATPGPGQGIKSAGQAACAHMKQRSATLAFPRALPLAVSTNDTAAHPPPRSMSWVAGVSALEREGAVHQSTRDCERWLALCSVDPADRQLPPPEQFLRLLHAGPRGYGTPYTYDACTCGPGLARRFAAEFDHAAQTRWTNAASVARCLQPSLYILRHAAPQITTNPSAPISLQDTAQQGRRRTTTTRGAPLGHSHEKANEAMAMAHAHVPEILPLNNSTNRAPLSTHRQILAFGQMPKCPRGLWPKPQVLKLPTEVVPNKTSRDLVFAAFPSSERGLARSSPTTCHPHSLRTWARKAG